MKAVKAKRKILERIQTKTLFTQFQLFTFYMPASLQKYIRGRVLSIRAFFLGRALFKQ